MIEILSHRIALKNKLQQIGLHFSNGILLAEEVWKEKPDYAADKQLIEIANSMYK